MAKYKNKLTGTVVEPSSEVAAQTFERSPDWEKVTEKASKPKNENGRNGETEEAK